MRSSAENSTFAVHAADPNDRVGKLLLTEQTIWVAHPDLKLDPTRPVPLALFDRDCWWPRFGHRGP